MRMSHGANGDDDIDFLAAASSSGISSFFPFGEMNLRLSLLSIGRRMRSTTLPNGIAHPRVPVDYGLVIGSKEILCNNNILTSPRRAYARGGYRTCLEVHLLLAQQWMLSH